MLIFSFTLNKQDKVIEVFPIDKKVEQLFKEVSRRIFRLQNGRSLDSMERIGADTRGQIGASYLSLKNLAGQYQPDLRLAQLLWETRRTNRCLFFIPGSRVDYRKNYSIITILLQLRDRGIFRDIGSFETGKRGTNGK